jgi:hypothetical protein
MHVVGLVEIIAGLIVLSRWARIGSCVVLATWHHAEPGHTGMHYDLAMRDVEIAIGAFALTQLSAVREQQATLRSKAKGMAGSQFVETR